MIACFGETTGIGTLHQVLETMQSSDEGRAILADRPRINSSTIDLDALHNLPPETLGYAYKKFLTDNVCRLYLNRLHCNDLARQDAFCL